MIKAVIFDCFGVITTDGLDVLITECEVGKPSLRGQISDVIDRANRGRMPLDESRRRVAQLLDMTPHEYSMGVHAREARNNDLLEFIRQLRQTYTTVLLTNVTRESLNKRFTRRELETYFDYQFVSGELGIAKPDIEIYECVLTSLNMPASACVFTDDRQRFLDPAFVMGMHTILFKNNEQFFADIAGILPS
ncbi:MAG: HAD-IA family hydrolase [Candidatus Saccharimonadales bacterium]